MAKARRWLAGAARAVGLALVAAFGLHVIGALNHQLGLKDPQMSRMGFGPR